MKKVKKSLISILAMITACGMLSASALADEVPVETAVEVPAEAAEGIPAEAVEEPAPEAILGAWILYRVYEVSEGAEPTLLKKDENQSLYGSGTGIYNFDDAGTSHHIMFDAGESVDMTGLWEIAGENLYLCREDPESMTLRYVPEEDLLHRDYQADGRTLDFVYARAFIGSWKLEKVQFLIEGDVPMDLTREEYPDVYIAGEYIFTFHPDKTAKSVFVGAEETVDYEGLWVSDKPNYFAFGLTEEEMEMGAKIEFTYFSTDDVIFQDVDYPFDWGYSRVRYIYTRVETDPEEDEAEEETTTAQQSADQSADYTNDYSYYDPEPYDPYYDDYDYNTEPDVPGDNSGDAEDPAGDGTIPAGDGTDAGDADGTDGSGAADPAGDGTVPAGDGTDAGDAGGTDGSDAADPAGDGTVPAGDGTVPAGDGTVPAGDGTDAGDAGGTDGSGAADPAGDGTVPAGDGTDAGDAGGTDGSGAADPAGDGAGAADADPAAAGTDAGADGGAGTDAGADSAPADPGADGSAAVG